MVRRLGSIWLLLAGALAAQPVARHSPDWLRDGAIYEVNTRTFSASGDFRGVTEQLPRLKELGVNILWLMPIHPVGRERSKGTLGSPYAVRDYFAINPDYGTADDLRQLISEAHRGGFKVIIDIVANHTAWDSVMLQTPGFYKHDAAGKIISPVPDWADVAALDYANPELRAYMTHMLVHWIKQFDLDGFRCDVAGMVPTDFWENARSELEKVKPEIMLLAEWHSPDLVRKAFDLDYSWPLHSKLTDVLENGTASARDLRKEWEEERRLYPKGALHLRFSDNHDEKRAIARFGERGALAASALMFTLDGVPMLYNGMEVGDTTESGAPALFERLPVFWQIAERRPEFPEFYRMMIPLRRAHRALGQGETEWLENSDPDRIVTYVRRGAGEEFLVAINCSNRGYSGRVQVAGSSWTEETHSKSGGSVGNLQLAAWEFRIFHRVQ
jgi:cyclomaltodextrinase / maltogenic alpha-amylase / neopullulanase